MDDTAPDTALEEIVEMDVRSVAVIWTDDKPQPDVTWFGCSAYEAIGFLHMAIRKLEADFAFPRFGDDEDQDYDDA